VRPKNPASNILFLIGIDSEDATCAALVFFAALRLTGK
jgi:hypothetical protein